MENLKQYLPAFYEDAQKNIKLFKKESYPDNFAAYQEKNKEATQEIRRLLMRDEEDNEAVMHQIAEAVCDCAAALLAQEKGKVARESLQLNLNMVTVLYLIPAIQETKCEKAGKLSEAICAMWNGRFKGNNIKPSDFASIQNGFRDKLCYITTAVCRSLDKPEDCYELTLLKQYRDGYLSETRDGQSLIRNYYDIAPTIVKRIEKRTDAAQQYLMIWEHYLKPCIALIEARKNEECGLLYRSMVEKLHKEYMEDYHE